MKTRVVLTLSLLVILLVVTLGSGSLFRSLTVAHADADYNTDGSTCSQAVLNYTGPSFHLLTNGYQVFLRANVGSNPTNYDSGASTYNGQNPFTLTVALPSGIAQGTVINLYDIFYGHGNVGIATSYVCSGSGSAGSGGRPISFTDGRLNNEEQWQTAAIWCDGDDVLVYRVVDSVGQFAFRATKAQIEAASHRKNKPALVKKALGVSLYVDPDGGLTVMAPNLDPTKSDPYTFSWSGCPL